MNFNVKYHVISSAYTCTYQIYMYIHYMYRSSTAKLKEYFLYNINIVVGVTCSPQWLMLGWLSGWLKFWKIMTICLIILWSTLSHFLWTSVLEHQVCENFLMNINEWLLMKTGILTLIEPYMYIQNFCSVSRNRKLTE